ncbi:MAG: DUF3298 domain-containing protein [Desulfovibrio sp.]|nr:DUF3298 domain-containing protein [Desulfovibrio sp.]
MLRYFVFVHLFCIVVLSLFLNEARAAYLTLQPVAHNEPAFLNRDQAMAVISGSKQPGILEHLLVRPASEKVRQSRMSIMLHYPSIGQKDVDTDIRQWITGIADAFEQHFNYDALMQEMSTDGLGRRIELYSVYGVSRPSSKAISFTFELWNDTGGEHANLDVITLNYSLINGQRLELSDIFGRPDEALQLMSAWTRSILSKRYGSIRTQMLKSGTEPLVENFSSLTLIPNGICINFQPYQVATWEMGVQKVEMPLEALQPAEPLKIFWGK